jgi:hypothetical protein
MDSFSASEELQEFTRAGMIRIRLLNINTLLTHLMTTEKSNEALRDYLLLSPFLG